MCTSTMATTAEDSHKLLAGMGPEPLGDDFNVAALSAALHGKQTPIKAALLRRQGDGDVVLGAYVLDHIVPLAEGWMHPGVDLGARGNLAGMCKACHDDKTMAEAARAQGHRAPRARVRVAVGGDGWPRS